jgi:hypothetical protein
VIEGVAARPAQDDEPGDEILLAAGTRLRHDQSDYSFQMFDGHGIEELFVWERFAVLDGPYAGRCVAFYMSNPSSIHASAIPAELRLCAKPG